MDVSFLLLLIIPQLSKGVCCLEYMHSVEVTTHSSFWLVSFIGLPIPTTGLQPVA